MRNPANELQKAIYDAIKGNLIIGYEQIDVYDKVPNRPWNQAKQYDTWVHISSPILQPFQAAKDAFLSTLVANFEIISLFKQQSNAGGQKIVNDIADQIMFLLIQRGGSPLSLQGYQIIGQTLENYTTVDGAAEGGLLYVGGQLQIRYIIEQSSNT